MRYRIKQNNLGYLSRRAEDERKTEIVEKFTDKIYSENFLDIKRIKDKKLQKQGVDLIYKEGENIHYIDEKFALNYFNKKLYTFSFELFSENNVDKKGWLISDNMITTDYCILWFSSDASFQNIRFYDLCLIPKYKVLEIAKKAGYYEGLVQDFLDYWEKGYYNQPDKYYSLGERRYLKLKNGCKIVQSLNFEEKPINIVIIVSFFCIFPSSFGETKEKGGRGM